MTRSKIAIRIEAMRLRTLPVSLSGVIFAGGLAVCNDCFSLCPFLLCLSFALLSQIASNFANEYYDFKAGIDKAGREGPRRGVTEGDISPAEMKCATFVTLALACAIGCILVALYGRWWMYLVGVITALGVVAYSSGPFPLSHNGLGEVAVIVFFGIIPVTLSYMLMGGSYSIQLLGYSAGLGLMGANVLIVNNYRDADDDSSVGKNTLAVLWGRSIVASIYLANGFFALFLTLSAWPSVIKFWWLVPTVYLVIHLNLYRLLVKRHGAALNPLLGLTALLMLFYSLGLLLFAIIEKI